MKTKHQMLKELLKSGVTKEQIRSKNFIEVKFNINFKEWNFKLFDFSYADFRSANFSSANFSSANFRSADFSSANFSYADFSYADFSIKINECTVGLVMACPEEGSFIAYKKCKNEVIVKLQICEDAKRSSATTLKCRASKALVLDIEGGLNQVASQRTDSFIYIKGEIIEVNDFDENRWNECSTGIHFFMSKELAKQY